MVVVAVVVVVVVVVVIIIVVVRIVGMVLLVLEEVEGKAYPPHTPLPSLHSISKRLGGGGDPAVRRGKNAREEKGQGYSQEQHRNNTFQSDTPAGGRIFPCLHVHSKSLLLS